MEKVDAIKRILLLIDQVKHVDRFKGKAELLNNLRALCVLVETHAPMLNYDELCVKEAERLFNGARERLNEGVFVGQKD